MLHSHSTFYLLPSTLHALHTAPCLLYTPWRLLLPRTTPLTLCSLRALRTRPALCTLMHSLHSTLHPRHFTLHTLHPILYTLQHFTNHTSQSTHDIFTAHPTIHTLRFKLHTSHPRPYRLRTTLHTSQFTRYNFRLHAQYSKPLNFTLHKLHALHCKLYAARSALDTLHAPRATHHLPHSGTPCSTLRTLHSTLQTWSSLSEV